MLFSGARPIQPGKTERARRVTEELEEHRTEYETLNAKYRVRAHAMWVSHPKDGGDIYVAMYDIEPEDLRVMGGRAWDPEHSAYDRWWLEWVKDVLGIDMLIDNGFLAPPEAIFSWTAG